MNNGFGSGSHYSVGLPINAYHSKFGALDTAAAAARRQQSIEIIQNTSGLTRQFYQYLAGYSSSSLITLGQYKDLLIALAIGKSVRSAQAKDMSYTQLTNHSLFWWKSFCFREAWPEGSTGTHGPLGSLAYYIPDGQPNNPMDFLNAALDAFWEGIGLSYSLAPEVRHSNLLAMLMPEAATVAAWEAALNTLHTKDNIPDVAVSALKLLRSQVLGSSSWDNLYLRFLLGEINPVVAEALQIMFNVCTSNPAVLEYFAWPDTTTKPQDLFNKVQAFQQPSGMPQVYLALSIEAWLKAARLLITTFEHNALFAQLPYEGFFLLEDTKPLGRELATWLALAYDAWAVLAKFNTFSEASGVSYRSYLESLNLYRSAENPIKAGEPGRLILPVALT